jgi:3-methyladenine DNA glycosylase Mpg
MAKDKKTDLSFELPHYSTKVCREFFQRPSKLVAVDLLGKVLTIHHPNDIAYARILEVAAYEGKTRTSSPGIVYYPGSIGVSRKFNRNLLDISTGLANDPSCVTLVAAVVSNGEDRLVQGPGNLTDALGIDSSYDGRIIDCSPQLWIGGDSVDPDLIKIRKKSRAPENCKGYFYFCP